MSAGDVLFVGWTGGDPKYKELAPSIELEPAAGGLVSKRVTINRLCFDKDKQAVVQGLPTGNAAINSNYVDTDGSEKEQFLGGGYDLISVSNAPVGVGYSRVSAVYQKVVDSVFEIGLPPGLSLSCVDGKCQIIYNSTVLEEIDSGTGECTSGIGTFGELVGFSPYSIRSGGGYYSQRILNAGSNYDPSPLYDQAYYVFSVACNDFVFEELNVVGSDLATVTVSRESNYTVASVRSPSFDNLSLSGLQAWEADNQITQQEINLILDEYRSQYPDTEYVKNLFYFNRSREFFRNSSVQQFDVDDGLIVTDPESGETTETLIEERTVYSYSVVYSDVVRRVAYYTLPQNLRESFSGTSRRGQFIEPKASIVKNDNIIQFRLNHPLFKHPIVWREYDVTGM